MDLKDSKPFAQYYEPRSVASLRRNIEDAVRELTFAPGYLHALAQLPALSDSQHYDRLRSLGDVIADLSETALQAAHHLAEPAPVPFEPEQIKPEELT